MIGVHKSTISNYLNGVCEPKQDKLNAIAKALNVNVDWLAGEGVHMVANPTYDKIVSIIKDLEEHELKKVLQILVLMYGDGIE
jgi:transcriptional regulator with XRE-family HTH domain